MSSDKFSRRLKIDRIVINPMDEESSQQDSLPAAIKRRDVPGALALIDPMVVAEYSAYWELITPSTNEDALRSAIFAIMSVRASWKQNLKGFHIAERLGQDISMGAIKRAFQAEGVGLYKTKGSALLGLYAKWNNDPSFLWKGLGETWLNYRARLCDLKGLAVAKASFLVELLYPLGARIVCLDAHFKTLMGVTSMGTNPTNHEYLQAERKWLFLCDKHDIPSSIGRHIIWDVIQDQPDTRYWSYALEPETHAIDRIIATA